MLLRYTFLLLLHLFSISTLFTQAITAPADFEHLVPHRIGERWGFSDTLGQVRHQPRFDSVGFFQVCQIKEWAARAVFLEKGKRGMIDHHLNTIVPAEYDYLQLQYVADGGFIIAKKKGKTGALTLQGQPLVPLVYDNAGYNLTLTGIQIEKAGKKGLYSASGILQVKPEYDNITPHNGLDDKGKYVRLGFKAKKAGKNYFIDLNGKVILFEKAVFPKPSQTDEISVESPIEHGTGGGKAPEGEYAKKQRLKHEAKLAAIAYQLGVDSVKYLDPGSKFMMTFKNGKIGLAENEGSGRIIEPQYDEMPLFFYGHKWAGYRKIGSDHLFFVRKKDESLQCIGDDGKPVFPFVMDTVWKDGYGRIRYAANGLTGIFIPHSPYPLIPPKYEILEVAENITQRYSLDFLIFRVRKNGKYGFVSMNGVEHFSN